MADVIPALPEVEAYAARIQAAIDRCGHPRTVEAAAQADRRRVGRDVEGLREHGPYLGDPERGCRHDAFGRMQFTGPRPWRECPDALRYWTDLTEVGSLYGVRWCPSGDTDCTVDCGRCKGGTR